MSWWGWSGSWWDWSQGWKTDRDSQWEEQRAAWGRDDPPVAPKAAQPDPPAPQDVADQNVAPKASAFDEPACTGGNSAVAEKPGGNSAVAEEPQRIMDEEYFINYTKYEGEWTRHYRQHNEALKYFRDTLEAKGGTNHFELEAKGTPVEKIIHEPQSPTYRIDYGNFVSWRWPEMVAQLTDDSIRKVLGATDSKEKQDTAKERPCLVSCCVSTRPNSYDHRRHSLTPTDKELNIWDFLLTRNDGSQIRLRPAWSKTKVDVMDPDGTSEQVTPPTMGRGKSDGPGTFRKYEKEQRKCDVDVRFDGKKQPPPKGNGKGKKVPKGQPKVGSPGEAAVAADEALPSIPESGSIDSPKGHGGDSGSNQQPEPSDLIMASNIDAAFG